MTDAEIATLRQQATALRAQAMAVLMGTDALIACLPTPAPQEIRTKPTFLGEGQ